MNDRVEKTLAALTDDDNVDAIKSALRAAATAIDNPRVSRTLNLASAGLGLGFSAWKFARDRRSRSAYRIKIMETDPLYESLQELLIKELPYQEQKSLIVASKQVTGSSSVRWDEDVPDFPRRGGLTDRLTRDKVIALYYDGERRQEIEMKGHKVTIAVSADDNPSKKSSSRNQMTHTRSIYLECRSHAAREAVMETLTEEAKKLHKRRPVFRVSQKWGNFRTVSDIPTRPLESVILRDGQKERIIDELTKFLEQEDRYVSVGLPWHIGLLFYGAPGTGKTSIASAIAHSLGLDTYSIALSAVEDDNALMELVTDVRPRSVLLLEDVDVAHAAKERSDDQNGVTMGGLLNALDGIGTPHGIITLMTTNHIETLDPALIRPGRVDILEEIGFVDTDQVANLCKQFLGYVPEGLPEISRTDCIVAGEIVGVFKRNLGFIGEEKEGIEIDLLDTILRLKAKSAMASSEVQDVSTETTL